MKKIAMIMLVLFTVVTGTAQEYTTAIGLRAGTPYGVTLKHFISDAAAIEGILGSRWYGYTLAALYEVHQPIGDVDGLYLYYGGGGHISSYRNYRWGGRYYNSNTTLIGVDGIVGLEFVVPDVPLCFSIDWKPTFHFVEYAAFWPHEGALSIRYYF